MKALFAGSVLLAFAAVMPASAEPVSPAMKHNLQCFLAVSTLSSSRDPAHKTMGSMGALFFAGQVFGADPDVDLVVALKAEASTLQDEMIKPLLVECGREMSARGKQIQAAGAALSTSE